jgi:hypothetical protein
VSEVGQKLWKVDVLCEGAKVAEPAVTPDGESGAKPSSVVDGGALEMH